MGKRLNLEPSPNCYLLPGSEWPDGALRPDAPPEAYLARGATRRFRKALETRDWSTRQASKEIGLSTHVVHNFLHGKSWPSFVAIARIERRCTGVKIWGGEHKAQRQ